MLSDIVFLEKWQNLFDSCHWSTVFQSVDFIKIWFQFYQDEFDLFFICKFDKDQQLQGFFPLSQNKNTQQICIAGSYLAEYQTWLATEESKDIFISEALEILVKEFPQKKLEMPFIAPNTPLDFFKKDQKWSNQTELREHERPLIKVGDGSLAEESLKKKGNKTRLRQLNKIGKIEVESLQKVEELADIFDEIETYSRFRLSALHNVFLEYENKRKDFHLALMKIPNLIYTNLLKVDGKLASAKLFINNKGEMLQSITAMSPFLAQQSPSKIHTYFVWKDFAEKGIEIFDLSPGGGYKNRFATDCENVFSLTVFFNKQEFIKHQYRRKTVAFAKDSLEKMKLTKTKVFAISDKLSHKFQRVKRRTIPKTVWKNVKRKVYDLREVRVYMMKISDIEPYESDLFKKNNIADLLKYVPNEGWQFTISEFHQICLNRFEIGNHSYTLADENNLLHYGWLVENQLISKVYEVNQELNLPENSAVLYDFFTHPDARKKGLYQKAIRQILNEVAKNTDAKQVFISVLADNLPSKSVIEKLGFKYQGSLFQETKLGKTRRWKNFSDEADLTNSVLNLKENLV
jgi:RimJ/RimL family protein N-acetyltransferase/CelD/BcsL family acetyltransferase involved in cellulose biosynthesis